MKYIWANIYPTTHLWSACMLDDATGEISAIELERIDRYKNSPNLGDFSLISKIDTGKRSILENYLNPEWASLQSLNYHSENMFLKHHYLHACSVYFAWVSEDAAILCMDKNGYDSEQWHQFQTIWQGSKNSVELLESTQIHGSLDRGIGFAYFIFSEFCHLGEGALMWLSAYGDRDYYRDIKIFEYRENSVYFHRDFLKNTAPTSLQDYDQFDELLGNRDIIFQNICDIFWLTVEQIQSDNITDSRLAHLAACLQVQTEQAIVFLANRAYELTGAQTLCLAGGVALNILGNTAIMRHTPFEQVLVSPVSEDIWIALGSLYHLYHIEHQHTQRYPLTQTGFGKQYSEWEIAQALEQYEDYLDYEFCTRDEIYTRTAESIHAGKILGWFQGGSEFGPRALWHRSIIASPNSIDIRDQVNHIKSRAPWRPIAPSVLEEDLAVYFEESFPSPYMNFSGNIRPEQQAQLSWVVHIDGTSRYQSVSEQNHPGYYRLLKKYKDISGLSLMINTSLNVAGEPIVETPEDAIRMFLSTDLDALVLENTYITKIKKQAQFRFDAEAIRLERNLSFEQNQKALAYRRQLEQTLQTLFADESLCLSPHLYDSELGFEYRWARYALELFDATHIYLWTDKRIACMKFGCYELWDERVIEVLESKSEELYQVLEKGEYYLRDV